MHEKWARLGYDGIQTLEVEMLPNTESWISMIFDAHQEALRAAGNVYWQLPWGVRHPIEPKEVRIEKIGPKIKYGWLRFPEDIEQRVRGNSQEARSWRRLVEMIEEWPFHEHDDAPDALAGALLVDMDGNKVEEDVFDGLGIFS